MYVMIMSAADTENPPSTRNITIHTKYGAKAANSEKTAFIEDTNTKTLLRPYTSASIPHS
jgi:hypothetical protein